MRSAGRVPSIFYVKIGAIWSFLAHFPAVYSFGVQHNFSTGKVIIFEDE